MSGVALRCANCGTVQATPGECEACHEAAVRFFCTNHASGLWLDASSCPECGARFGEVAAAPRAPDRPTVPPPAALPEPYASDVAPEPSPWPMEPPRTSRGSSDGMDTSHRGALPNPWLDLLVSAAKLRKVSSASRDRWDGPPKAAAMGGCLKRMLTLVLALAVLFVLASMLIGGFLLQLL